MSPHSLTRLLSASCALVITFALTSCGTTTSQQAAASIKPADRVSAAIFVPPMATLYSSGGGGLGAAIVGELINAARIKDSQIPRDETFARDMRAVIEDELSRAPSFHYVRSTTLPNLPAPNTRDQAAFARLKAAELARSNGLRLCFKVSTALVYHERKSFALLASPAVFLRIEAESAEGAKVTPFAGFTITEVSTREEETAIKDGSESAKLAAYLNIARRATQEFLRHWTRWHDGSPAAHAG